jgi:hypothetical protein
MLLVKVSLVCVGTLLLMVAPLCAHGVKSRNRVRWIILSSQHLGAHGMGYSTRSMTEMSNRLSADDIPMLIVLAGTDSDIAIGAQFALASQCEPAIVPVRDAAVQHKMDFMDAQNTMSLIGGFAKCRQDTRTKASAMQHTLEQLSKEENARIDREYRQRSENEARIQRNGLKLLDPEQAKTLSREERLEIFHSSLAAMGLTEDGPMTPDQRKLVDRMYRSMVLDEIKTTPNQ